MRGKLALIILLGLLGGPRLWSQANPQSNPQSEPVRLVGVTVSGTNLILRWEGSVPPYKLQVLTDLKGRAWRDFTYHIYTNEYVVPRAYGDGAVFRVRTIPDRTAPTLAGGLTVVPNSCQSVSLIWSSAADNAGGTLLRGYRLYRNGTMLAELPSTTLNYQDQTVAASTSYEYQLTAVDNALNESSRTPAVGVTTPACVTPNQPPVANAGLARSIGLGQNLQFNGSASSDSDGSIANYAWNFGDGSTASGATVSHAFNSLGNFTVRLTVTDNLGATGSSSVLVAVTNRPPVANAGPNQTGTVNLPVTFQSTGSRDDDGTLVSYSWNFGDGSSSQNPNPSHAFAAVGYYLVTLTVTDNSGATATDAAGVTIGNPPNQPPVANAGSSRSTGLGQNLQFTGSASTDSDGSIASYAWNFGDGGTASGATVSHAFNSLGNFTVRLTVTDNLGATGSSSVLIAVTNRPPVAGAGPDQNGMVNVLLTFQSTASHDDDGTLVSYSWNFGDGSSSQSPTPSHAFAAAGNFLVTLTVTDNAGASATDSASVTITSPVNQPPVSNAGGNRTATVGQSVSFSGAGSTDSDGSVVNYSWNFGDGSTAAGVSVNHTYAAAGVFTVKLLVTDDDGASATNQATVTVSQPSTDGQIRAELAGMLPGLGLARDVEVVGSTAFVVGDELGLSVVNIAQPGAPVLIGVGDFPFDGYRVAVSGNQVIVTGLRRYYSVTDGVLQENQVNGLYVFDVSVPSQPHLVGKLEDANRVFNGCSLAGTKAYVAGGSEGLLVVDLSNAAAPRVVATADTPGTANSVVLVRTVALVADGSRGLTVVNLSSPLTPSVIRTIDTPNNAKDVAWANNLCYVADSQALLTFDITDAMTPVLRGSASAAGAVRVKADGSMAYVACGANGLVSVNAASSAAPVVGDSLIPSGGPSPTTLGVAVGSGIVAVANGGGGLGIVNKPAQPSGSLDMLRTVAEWNDGTQIAVRDGLAAVAFTRATNGGAISWFGLKLYDISNPAAPRALASVETNTFGFWQTAFYGNYLISACGAAGLKILDISNPSAPTLVGTAAVSGSARGIVIVGTRAYVAAGTEGLRIFDITNPRAPVSLGGLALGGNALSVAVEGTMAYVGGNLTLSVVDVSRPSAPVLRGTYAVTGSEVQVRQGVVYVAATGGGLIVVDATTPLLPRLLGQLLPPTGSGQTTVGLSLSGNFAFAANSGGGLAIIDISHPNSPVYKTAVSTAGVARSVAVQGDWAFCSDSKATMTSIRLY